MTMDLDDLPTAESEETVDPDELHVDGDNPNEQSDAMFGLLCENLQEKGWIGNAIVANTGDLPGYDAVPVKFYEFEDDAERRLWRQELNKISGEHDKKRDALEYDQLLKEGRAEDVHDLVDATGEDLDELLEEIRIDRGASVLYEYDVDHDIYFEDCAKGMRDRLQDDSIDCILTDPPYGVDWDTNSRDKQTEFAKVANDESLDDAVELWRDVVVEAKRVLAPDGHLYAFADWRTEREFRDVLDDAGFTIQNALVWDKVQMGLGGTVPVNYRTQYELVIFATLDSPRHLKNRGSDVFSHPRPDTSNLQHPTQKPAGLLVEFLERSTTEGDRVLDPFMGSGTTAVAAIQSGRDYVGFEIDEETYRQVIERRLAEAERQLEAGVNATAD